MAPKITIAALKKWATQRENKLLLWTMFGVGAGIAMGFIMQTAKFNALQRYYWNFPGMLVMNMLKCIIIPIITLSIMTGVADLAGASGRLSGYAMLYYLCTTVISIILGIVMSVIVKPGKGLNTGIKESKAPQTVADGLLDIIRNLIPPNVVAAMLEQSSTMRTADNSNVDVNWSLGTKNGAPSQNVLGLILIFSCFGYFLGKLKYKGNKDAGTALSIFNGMNDAVMEVVDLVMWIHPVGLVFLISNKIMALNEASAEMWSALGWLIFTTLVSIFIHALIFIPAIYFLIVRKNPFIYMYGVLQALVTAFGTASSAATLPITLRNLEINNKIDRRVTRFMIPLGATINMDGTALYEAVAALFIAQLNGRTMSFGNIVTIAITATAASIGAAAVPSAGLITLIIVLTAVNLPLDDIAWIYTVDWFLDRFRTATNVWGDCVGAACVQKVCQEDLDEHAAEAELCDQERT